MMIKGLGRLGKFQILLVLFVDCFHSDVLLLVMKAFQVVQFLGDTDRNSIIFTVLLRKHEGDAVSVSTAEFALSSHSCTHQAILEVRKVWVAPSKLPLDTPAARHDDFLVTKRIQTNDGVC